MKICIVDENDKVVGAKERTEIDRSKDRYRVSALWLTNSRGEALIAQRSFDKAHDPGKWGPAVAGTVEAEETYEINIRKEIGEEIGIWAIELQKGPHLEISRSGQYFVQWFLATLELPLEAFTPQRSEVNALAWIRPEQLTRELAGTPEKYIASMSDALAALGIMH